MASLSSLVALSACALLVSDVSSATTTERFVPTPSTEPIPLTFTEQTDAAETTSFIFRIPAPIDDPAPIMYPTPAFVDEPAPYPSASPTPFDQSFTFPQNDPAPATTLEPLVTCSDDCHGHSCDFYLSTHPTMTCDTLKNEYQCDCSGCACINTFQYSCLNSCSGVFPTCSCEATCDDSEDDDIECCSDFAIQCGDFDFSSIGDVSDAQNSMVGIIVGVGVVLLVVGGVGGFFITRKLLLNNRIARENELLKQGNANFRSDSYAAPSLRATTRGYAQSPKSEFNLL